MSLLRTESEEYFQREWNQKLIQNSAKMIRLLLIMMIIWSFFALGWIVHLILLRADSSKRDVWYTLHKRDDSKSFRSYMDLNFYTFVSGTDWERIKKIVGGFHQLKESPGKVPKITFFTLEPLDELKQKESSAWNKVEFKQRDLKAMNADCYNLNDSEAIWISSDYAFDPVALELRKAELLDEADEFKKAFQKGRETIESLANGCVDLIDDLTGEIVLKLHCQKRKIKSANDYGLMRLAQVNKAHLCHVDLKKESIVNGAEIVDDLELETLAEMRLSNSRKTLAIGVPTTSKGMKSFQEKHVLLTALIPSLSSTLTFEELKEFKIVLFIAYDFGDAYFERNRKELKDEMQKILPKSVSVIFLRLLPLQRVAMTWNMIFHLARRHFDFDYFYQVNDDLTMKTAGWLKKFSAKLDESDGIGVVGPSDSFNGFSCSLLTQAFVTRRHFEIFQGNFYPLAFKDWKSDRWLSFVYGPSKTFCWQEIEAANGAKGTRYSSCPFPEWKIYL